MDLKWNITSAVLLVPNLVKIQEIAINNLPKISEKITNFVPLCD